MKRLVIAIDCDDVLVATTPFFIAAYNAKYGTNISLAESHIGHEDQWKADRDLQVQRLDELTKTEEYFKIAPSPEESVVLNELSKVHSLHLVTARKPEELERTQAMIDRDLPGVFTSLDFVGWTGSKGEVCNRIGADILVDDAVRNLVDAVEKGMPKSNVILFGDFPWNADIPEPLEGIKRCVNWSEVKVAIDAIANAE